MLFPKNCRTVHKTLWCLPLVPNSVSVLAISLAQIQPTPSDSGANSLFWVALASGTSLMGLTLGYCLGRRGKRRLNEQIQSVEETRDRLQESVKDLRESLEKQKEIIQKARIADITEDTLQNLNTALQTVHLCASMVEKYAGDLNPGFLKRLTAILRDLEQPSNSTAEKIVMLKEAVGRTGQKLQKTQDSMNGELKRLHEQVFRIHEMIAAQRRCTHGIEVLDQAHLREVLEDVLKIRETTMEEFKIQLVRRYENVPQIQCSKIKLLHVFNQIIKNACHSLMLSKNRENRILAVHLAMKGEDRIRLEIQDNGIGIEKQNLTRIFAHGFSTWPQKEGLGLHHCAAVMSEMGGMIGVKSMGPDTGASFVLEIPVGPATKTNQIKAIREDITNIRNH